MKLETHVAQHLMTTSKEKLQWVLSFALSLLLDYGYPHENAYQCVTNSTVTMVTSETGF